MKRPDDQTGDAMGAGYAILTIGVTFALTLTICVLIGLWIDRRLGTMPLCTVLGALAGMGLGGFWMYQRLRRTPPGSRR